MSLVNQTCWVVGGVGVVGRGITRGLLQAGANVIVNSRSEVRLDKLRESLDNPSNLYLVHGSLLPGRASKTVADTLTELPLHHVVAHGAVRWWARPSTGSFENHYEYKAGCDESFSLNIQPNQRLLDYRPEEFVSSSAQLASLHFSAAQQLIPRIQFFSSYSGKDQCSPSYTFVTGDGSGKPGGGRTAMAEINSHHVWGLSAALRSEHSSSVSKTDSSNTNNSNVIVNCREVRLGIPTDDFDNSPTGSDRSPESSPLSEEIGNLCAGLVASSSRTDDNGRLVHIQSRKQMDQLLEEYKVEFDANKNPLPHYYCES